MHLRHRRGRRRRVYHNIIFHIIPRTHVIGTIILYTFLGVFIYY